MEASPALAFDPRLVRIEDEEDVQIDQGTQPPVAKKSKTGKGPRSYLIDSYHLQCLVSRYHFHFNKYSIGRKQTTQMVPGKVWKLVYADYQLEFPASNFAEESLKDKLRDSLKELKTGTSNEENTGKAVLQSEDVLTQLRATDSHAARNVLKKRQSLVDQISSGSNQSNNSTIKNGSTADKEKVNDSTVEMEKSNTTEKEKEKPLTKTAILAETSRGFTTMSSTYVNEGKNRDGLNVLKMESEKKRCRMFGTKDRSIRIHDLMMLRNEGFYTDEEYRREMALIIESS